MLSKINLTESQKEIIYLPKHTTIPTQDSPQCYYFSFLHLYAMHSIQNNAPNYVKEIVEACKHKTDGYREIMIHILTAHAEELTWIADEIIDEEDSDYEGDWIEDFLDKYGVDFAMARLLSLSVKALEDINIVKYNLTMAQLRTILQEYGPIAIRLKRGNNLPIEKLSVSEKIITLDNSLEKESYNADNYPENIPHCVLLIGAREQSTQQVYFIDPNYPQIILSMQFELFKESLLMSEFVYFNKSNLKEDDVIFLTVKHKNKENNSQVNQASKRRKANPINDNSMNTNNPNVSLYETNNNSFSESSLSPQLFFKNNQIQTAVLEEQELGQLKLPLKNEY